MFEYDAAWAPPELGDRRDVVFRSENVRIQSWDEDHEAYDQLAIPVAAGAAGQVSSFDWDGADGFALDTFLLRLEFRAARGSVTTSAGPSG